MFIIIYILVIRTGSVTTLANISVINNFFHDFSSTKSGSVISITSNAICLQTISNIYNKCSTSGKSNGGSIYFSSNGVFIMTKSCAIESCGYFGYFYYILGLSEELSANTELNETSTFECSGNGESVCGHYYCNLKSSEYNSSYCFSSTSWCNVQTWYNQETYASFYQFYENSLSILFGACSRTTDHYLHYAIFLSNHYSAGTSGYIHTNFFDSQKLYARNIYAFSNTGTLVACAKGSIIIESLTCDSFTTTHIYVNSENVIIDQYFSPFFIFESESKFCEYFSNEVCFSIKKKLANNLFILHSLFIVIFNS